MTRLAVSARIPLFWDAVALTDMTPMAAHSHACPVDNLRPTDRRLLSHLMRWLCSIARPPPSAQRSRRPPFTRFLAVPYATESESLAVSGSAAECPGEGFAAFPEHRHEGDGAMHAAIAVPGNSRTILTHVFGHGLEDDRNVVERFRAMADGDIRRMPGGEPARKGRCKAKRTIASLKVVRQMRPARTEIIICTGLRIKGGVQPWGDIATGIFCDRKQKG